MKLKSKTPGRLVQKRVRRGNKLKVVPWFRFDAEGYATIDETKVSKTDMAKLMRYFEVVEEDLSKLPFKEIQKRYSEKTGLTAVGKKKTDMLKEL